MHLFQEMNLPAQLDQIALLNKVLGGNTLTIDGLQKLIKTKSDDQPIHIIDLGCGNGDMLRAIANYGRKKKHIFKLTGIDINQATVNHAKALSQNYPEIEFARIDFFSNEFKELKFDIALATLVAHHLSNDDIIMWLKTVLDLTTIGIVINDLQRSSVAYYLYKLFGVFVKNKHARQDGLVSILRGFKNMNLLTCQMS